MNPGETFNVNREPLAVSSELEAVSRGPLNVSCERKNDRKTYPCRVVGGTVAEDLFKRGLCLPSGTAMKEEDLDRVVETILNSRPR